LVSSLFPHLPRAKMASFHAALGLGIAAILVLALGGLYPVALVTAAILIPLLTVLYLYDVDIYEGEPIRVVAFTMAFGIAGGIIVALIGRALAPANTDLLVESTTSALLVRVVLPPVLSLVFMLAGPLTLLPYKNFNDVLDGATFGASSAVSFAGAMVITQAAPLFSAGLRPVGRAVPWIYRLLALGVASPVLAAAVVGAAAGAFWLRYRAPVKDRAVLGAMGHPAAAVVVALIMLILAALAQFYISAGLALLCLVVLGLVSLVLLRRVLHVGLLEEAREVEVGPDITCPNCGQQTPHHTFCSKCGVSLGALPKGWRTGPTPSTEAPGGAPA